MSAVPAWLRNTFAVAVGILVGSIVNMTIITVGPSLIPPPAGVDTSTADGLRAGIHLFTPKHFLTPFLAHAIGTFFGALVAFKVAATRRTQLAYGVGAFFLLGGIAASVMIPAPAWFIAADLMLAYIPMAWLATKVGEQRTAT
jgi:pimeloyl-ACP methyl ester carboxylesterase